MRAVLGLATVLACVMTTGIGAQERIRLVAGILGADGQPPASIAPEHLRVTEDGTEGKVVSVELIKREVKLQVLVDNGLGLGQDGLLHVRNGLSELFKSLPEGLRGTLVSTAPNARFLQRETNNREQLLQAVGRLTPDSSPGRFVEALKEALQRADRDGGDSVHVIVMAATTAGERDTRDSDIQEVTNLAAKVGANATLHVVLLDAGTLSSTDGITQREVGQAVAGTTGGTFEFISAAGRLATILPEIGRKIAESHVTIGNQFRITVERPQGKKGDVGRLQMRGQGEGGGLNIVSVSFE